MSAEGYSNEKADGWVCGRGFTSIRRYIRRLAGFE